MNNRLRECVRVGVAPALLHEATCLQMPGGGGSVAEAPDYKGAAEAQGAASKEIATQKTYSDRPDQYTPWGSTTWDASTGIDEATGQSITNWTQSQKLNPQIQAALEKQLGLQSYRTDLGAQFASRVGEDFSKPFDWTNLPGVAEAPEQQFTQGREADYGGVKQITTGQGSQEFVDERHRLENAAFDRMRPEHEFQNQALQTQLANQGLTIGSDAYNREYSRLSGQQADERFKAVEAGGLEQQRMQAMQLSREQQAFGQRSGQQDSYNKAMQQMFGQDLSANAQNYQQALQGADYQNKTRQQAISEQTQQRNMSLNELNALLHGQQVTSPQMPSFSGSTAAQAPQYMQAAQAQGSYDQNAAQMESSSNSSMWAGLGSLAGAAMIAFSDSRLKENVKKIGEYMPNVGVYIYQIFGRTEIGVMAHELLAVRPDLVHVHPSGYLMVDYGGLT